jgi:type IV pilus assembly protein PilN
MRLNINLATRKYEDARSFYLRWGGTLALLLAFTVVLSIACVSNYRNSRNDRKRIDDLQKQISVVESERTKNQEILDRPENRDVRDQLGFWNGVIYEKTLSWTVLLADLEKIMPSRAYLVSVQPSITKDHRIQLHLMIGGEKHSNAVELVHRMEESDHFRFPELYAEQVKTTQGKPPTVEFDIKTFYTPTGGVPQFQSDGREGMQ